MMIRLEIILFDNIIGMANFDWIPYLEGKYMTYYQIMAMIFSLIAVLLSLICFVVYLIASKLGSHQKLKNLCFRLIFHSLSSIPLICQAFDVIDLIEGIIGTAFILVIGVILQNGRQNWSKYEYQPIRLENAVYQFLKISLRFNSMTFQSIVKVIVISTVLNLFLYKTCVSFYNMEIGFQSKLFGISLNSYVTRMFQLKTSCPPGPPCHMYATVPEDASTSFFLNIHTHTQVNDVIVTVQKEDSINEAFNVTAKSFNYEGLEWRTARNVHSALITDLESNTKYQVRVFYQGKYWINGIYKTLPNDPATPVRMINAGDSGYCPGAVNLSKIVATLHPDIFFMGGDIAYDNNIPACSYTWDYFLGMYGQITETIGYLMPIVVTVGNHDAGLNELSGINITVDNTGPAFIIYFPQHYDRDPNFQIIKQVPPIQHRRTVTSFTFSNVHFTILDSGYLHGFDGWQKQYLYESFEAHRDKVKFVNYHVPIYGSCEGFDRSPQRFLYALFHWVPAFDKYKVVTVFQNHVHAFKRTKPLISSSPVERGGTVYLGDGSYGAFNQLGCHPDASIGIFEKFNSFNNFWMTDVFVDRVEHKCYNSHGQIIDQFTQKISDYRLVDQQIHSSSIDIDIDSLLPTQQIFQQPNRI